MFQLDSNSRPLGRMHIMITTRTPQLFLLRLGHDPQMRILLLIGLAGRMVRGTVVSLAHQHSSPGARIYFCI